MTFPCKAIVFDLDGTILDTLTDLYFSVSYALSEAGLTPVTKDQVRLYTGNGMERLVRLSMGLNTDNDLRGDRQEVESLFGNKGATEAEVENKTLTTPDSELEALFPTVYSTFRSHYAIHSMDHTGPYPGISELLKWLKDQGFLLAVVSNKGDAAVQPLIADLFPGIFDFVCGEKEGLRRKPAPDMVFECLRQLGVSVKDAVYVGDSEVDIATAIHANMPCITVTWGFRDRKQQVGAGAEFFAETPADVEGYVQLS